jgi:hypothetical protein
LEEPSLAPKQENFTLLIEAWSTSREPDALEQTENILQLMQDLTRQYEKKTYNQIQEPSIVLSTHIHDYKII